MSRSLTLHVVHWAPSSRFHVSTREHFSGRCSFLRTPVVCRRFPINQDWVSVPCLRGTAPWSETPVVVSRHHRDERWIDLHMHSCDPVHGFRAPFHQIEFTLVASTTKALDSARPPAPTTSCGFHRQAAGVRHQIRATNDCHRHNSKLAPTLPSVTRGVEATN